MCEKWRPTLFLTVRNKTKEEEREKVGATMNGQQTTNFRDKHGRGTFLIDEQASKPGIWKVLCFRELKVLDTIHTILFFPLLGTESFFFISIFFFNPIVFMCERSTQNNSTR